MADPHKHSPQPSQMDIILQTMGLTRNDLQRHKEQMRDFLSADEKFSFRSFPEQHSNGDTSSMTPRSSRSAVSNSHSTSVKLEPIEQPLQPKITMEMVMERKERQKKKDRKRRYESKARSHDHRRVSSQKNRSLSRSQTPSFSPETPHHYRYYSERVIESASGSNSNQNPLMNNGFLPHTPSRCPSGSSLASFDPITPQGRTIYNVIRRRSTPLSSPAPVVNFVSSPGPIMTRPESGTDIPSFTLPPGPYSLAKPDLPYAAMIGQALLASPEHRLTLQEIYEYISTVYPFYNRSETTWQNSIRHSLSTMAVFRKITRGKNEGKSLWAIFDQDLPCFANGGFRKALCADMVKDKPAPAKSGPKKRTVLDDAASRHDPKRRRKADEPTPGPSVPTQPVPQLVAVPILPPFYQPLFGGTHHQPYYQQYVPQHPPHSQHIPAEVIFPPLPPRTGCHPLSAVPIIPPPASDEQSSRSPSLETSKSEVSSRSSSECHSPIGVQFYALSASSVPELSHSSGSSSSPEESPAVTGSDPVDTHQGSTTTDADAEFAEWLATDLDVGPADSISRIHTTPKISPARSLARTRSRKSLLLEPPSPTVERRSAAKQKQKASERPPKPIEFGVSLSMISESTFHEDVLRQTTPPPRPSTPPRKRSTQISPQRTPLSHRGLHMSPSPSLAHYKNNLDPPPPAAFRPQAPLLYSFPSSDDSAASTSSYSMNPELLKTPSRKRASSNFGSGRSGGGSGSGGVFPFSFSPFPPVTPKRLFGSSNDSPFRTPSRSLIDGHEPCKLLNEELDMLRGSSFDTEEERRPFFDSPTGLFGMAKTGFFASPGPDVSVEISPGALGRRLY
ncbi:hypothetical protein ABKN59_005919 [Abortiporus biennis]